STSSGGTTTKPKSDTTTSKPKTSDKTTKPDSKDEKKTETKKKKSTGENKSETPAVTTGDKNDGNQSGADVVAVADTGSDNDKLFFGLSNGSALAVGVPLLIAVFAVGAIMWRNRKLGALPTSNHNFHVDYSSPQSASTVTPPAPTITPNPQPQQPTNLQTPPPTAGQTFQPSQQPPSADGNAGAS